jgi:osmotically-inducible protein OsmY
MNLTAVITLPGRLGYEVARRVLDLAAAAGHVAGLGGSDAPAPARKPEPARRPTRAKRGMDDVTLARKVETEIFRVRGVAKGKIDVNAADGVVWLRGEARTPELIKRVEARAAAIPEVARVENLLHLPKTPAPTRTDTPPPQRRTRTASDRTAARETKAKAERAKAERESRARTVT